MDWRSLQFDWNRARAFLATAETGSLSAAAVALGLTQPTLSRQVEALEAELGAVLFERVGRGLALTPDGRALLAHVRAMGQAAEQLSQGAHGLSQAVEGVVRITTSEVYAAHLLPPVLARLRREHPGIRLEVIASNRKLDLLRREADIAIRNATTTEPELVIRKLRDDTARAYATPALLRRLGQPRRWQDLRDAPFLGFVDDTLLAEGLARLGVPLTGADLPLRSDSHLVQWEWVRRGMGIGLITEAVGDAERRVRRVLPDAPAIRFPMWLVAHRQVRTSRRLRLVFDMLAETLAAG